MSTGVFIALGILVNCIWGMAFLIPYILPEVNPMVIAFGRYMVYGLVSLVLILLARKSWDKLSNNQWMTAFTLAFSGNVGYYLFLTSSIHYSGITISALIVGILPVSLIIVGNFVEKEYSFKSLVVPVALILSGMVTLSISNIESGRSNNLLEGALFAFISLVLWTYYGVKNADFLKKNPNVSSNSWSLAIGVCCLTQSIIALPILIVFTNTMDFSTGTGGGHFTQIIAACLFLGVVVSWLATILWNQTSRYLPVALAGQLIVFETISGLIYGFIADERLPNSGEFAAIVLVILGVVSGLRGSKRLKANVKASQCTTT
ncbi:DMT family transporter [Vibrio sp. SCSIO 43136]|uniref:DMT family transporter n=1 Tax=Vibrio sp. SCSIO 43136 TaxID=2819101 RepID=UPI0020763BED|nr:DMT family transporter [Vibrio sp. SCSIO 43136]USD66449.1 DMT family transporter [Vibrio sp. SCSIO 43136]